jgi:hypothetical protein
MVAPLRRVLVRPPGDVSRWAEYGWRAAPDPAGLAREHETFCALLEEAGAEVVVADPVDGNPDGVYAYDPALVADAGAILLRPGKAGRLSEVEPMRAALAFAMLPSQIGAAVLGGLGTLGLILATFGLYAIIAFTVSRRLGEIAIRSALGATRGRIIGLVVRDAAVLVTIGVTLGLGLAAFVTQPLATWLVTGLSTTDPLSFAGTGGVFLVVAVLASWIPARQATRVSPVIAMRLE